MIRIPHLETDVLFGLCECSCVACNHAVPLWRTQAPRLTSPASIERDLAHLSTILHADVWGALGGEPLLHPDLVKILKIVRASGIADTIEVWTNGIKLAQGKWPEGFWEAEFDTLVVSLYPGRMDDDAEARVKELCDTHGRVFSPRDERRLPNFRTLLEPQPTTHEVTRRKFAGCFFRHFSRNVTNGYFFTCCCGPHLPATVQGRPYGTDGVAIEGLTEVALRAYLQRTEPLGACTICAGRDTAVPIVWSEEKDPETWLRKSRGEQ